MDPLYLPGDKYQRQQATRAIRTAEGLGLKRFRTLTTFYGNGKLIEDLPKPDEEVFFWWGMTTEKGKVARGKLQHLVDEGNKLGTTTSIVVDWVIQ